LRSKHVTIPSSLDEPKRDVARPGDIKVSTLNPGKAKRELAWEARYTLHDGLVETIEWYRTRAC
jgi:UDP-glucose 4-epimerase